MNIPFVYSSLTNGAKTYYPTKIQKKGIEKISGQALKVNQTLSLE